MKRTHGLELTLCPSCYSGTPPPAGAPLFPRTPPPAGAPLFPRTPPPAGTPPFPGTPPPAGTPLFPGTPPRGDTLTPRTLLSSGLPERESTDYPNFDADRVRAYDGDYIFASSCYTYSLTDRFNLEFLPELLTRCEQLPLKLIYVLFKDGTLFFLDVNSQIFKHRLSQEYRSIFKTLSHEQREAAVYPEDIFIDGPRTIPTHGMLAEYQATIAAGEAQYEYDQETARYRLTITNSSGHYTPGAEGLRGIQYLITTRYPEIEVMTIPFVAPPRLRGW